jgi:hypothetical protein
VDVNVSNNVVVQPAIMEISPLIVLKTDRTGYRHWKAHSYRPKRMKSNYLKFRQLKFTKNLSDLMLWMNYGIVDEI